MTSLVNRVEVTPGQARAFREDGALKLSKFLTPGGVETLRRMVERELGGGGRAARGGPGGKNDFRRAKYDVGNQNPVTRRLLESPELRRALHALIPARLLFTQGIGFELTPGKAGLDWHFDFISFCFIHPLDPGYTLWIPFDPIDPARQGGGLEYVPESVHSGRDRMMLTFQHVLAGPKVIEKLGGREAYREQMPCAAAEKVVLDAAAIEPAFSPGDALVTNRYVWHRSCPLEKGRIRRRLAFVMRFVDAGARYHRTLCRKLVKFSAAYGNPGFKADYGLSFTDLADGDPMIASRLATDIV